MALAVERTEPGIMLEGPRPKTESLLERKMILGVVLNVRALAIARERCRV